MGYKGEKASLNQFTKLSEYLQKSGALEQAKNLASITEAFKKRLKEKKGLESITVDSEKKPFPFLSFDAGMARFFQGSPFEFTVLKVAGAGNLDKAEAKEVEKDLLKQEFLHVFSGLVKNPNVFSEITKRQSKKGALLLAQMEVERLFETGILKELDELLKEEFQSSLGSDLIEHLKSAPKLPELDNLCRDLGEWFFILRALKALKNQDTLVVKDGSLIVNPSGLTSPIYSRLKDIYLGKKENFSPLLVGIVKESRFLKDEGHLVSKAIWSYARENKKHQFFKIPDELDSILDSSVLEERSVARFFLSLFSGKNVFEIQVPKALMGDSLALERVKMTLLSQVTSLYGGSLVANSLAHKAASISEAEARALEKEITIKLFGE